MKKNLITSKTLSILRLQPKKWHLSVYIITIILLVVLPLNSSSSLNSITVLQLRGDYFFHIMMFLPWAFFSGIFNMKKSYWLLIGLLFAIGSEALQYLLPYRAYNVNDLLANGLGILIGYLLAIGIKNLTRKRSH